MIGFRDHNAEPYFYIPLSIDFLLNESAISYKIQHAYEDKK